MEIFNHLTSIAATLEQMGHGASQRQFEAYLVSCGQPHIWHAAWPMYNLGWYLSWQIMASKSEASGFERKVTGGHQNENSFRVIGFEEHIWPAASRPQSAIAPVLWCDNLPFSVVPWHAVLVVRHSLLWEPVNWICRQYSSGSIFVTCSGFSSNPIYHLIYSPGTCELCLI